MPSTYLDTGSACHGGTLDTSRSHLVKIGNVRWVVEASSTAEALQKAMHMCPGFCQIVSVQPLYTRAQWVHRS